MSGACAPRRAEGARRAVAMQRAADLAEQRALQLGRELRALACASQQDAGTLLTLDGQSLRMLAQQLGQRAARLGVQLGTLHLPGQPVAASLRLEGATAAAMGAAASLRILAASIAARPAVQLHAEDLRATFDGLASAAFEVAEAAAETARTAGGEAANEVAP